MPSKKPTAATPSPAADDAAMTPVVRLPAPDPGPPPPYPHPASTASWALSVMHDLFNAGRNAEHALAREAVQVISVFRHPPEVAQYKAEILSWIDKAEAYWHGVKKNT